VCLVDIRMPRLDGIVVTRALAGPDVVTPPVSGNQAKLGLVKITAWAWEHRVVGR
jgi:hypothetical protein